MFKNLFDFSKSPILNLFRKKKEESITVPEPIQVKENTYIIVAQPSDEKIIEASKTLVANWDEKGEGLPGEAKRHQVYAKLIKIFPEAERKRMCLIIELVINKCV